MNNELSFLMNDATFANLRELDGKVGLLEQRRICELYELSVSLCDNSSELFASGMSTCEILSLIASYIEMPVCEIDESTFSALRNYARFINANDKIVLARLICDNLINLGISVSESDFLPVKQLPDTFVYVKNSLSDEAYDVFSQEFDAPRLSYVSSFKEALNAVSTSVASYALLPIEERGSRLASVTEMIFGGDFKIASVTPVLGFDGLADMKYALISKYVRLPSVHSDDDRYFEFRIPTSDDLPLDELLCASHFYGCEVYRLNTVTFSTDDGLKPYFSVVLRREGGDFSALLAYLTLFADDFSPVGVYKNLE